MSVKNVAVSGKLEQGYEISLSARDLKLKIDQPEPWGGNKGPTPLEYFLFALVGCIITISKNVAEERGIDLKDIQVEIQGELETDYLNGLTKEGRAGFTNIEILVDIDAALTFEEKTEFLHEVDSRCPISDNILNPSHITVSVKK